MRERIVVDWQRDTALNRLYHKILADAGVREGDLLAGDIKGNLLKRVFRAIKENVKYDDKAVAPEEASGAEL